MLTARSNGVARPARHPCLSVWDAAPASDSSLDPLGLYQIGDALASRLAPGVRERMSRARYLTLLAVSARVCREVDESRLDRGDGGDPSQVFEWRIVEALVRADRAGAGAARALPGRDKVADALRRGKPINATTYLRSPRVMGFHGVYRTLGRTLGIECDAGGRSEVGETGGHLLDAWETDHSYRTGFQAATGSGGKLLSAWVGAVEGRPSASAGVWESLGTHLNPSDAGPTERAVLRDLLLSEAGGGYRGAVYDELARWSAAPTTDEQAFYRALAARVDGELHDLLRAIEHYEAFARAITNAFEAALDVASRTEAPASAVAKLPVITGCAAQCPKLWEHARAALEPYPERHRFEQRFARLSDPHGWVAPLDLLLEHHEDVQREKGKGTWLERWESGRLYALHSRELRAPTDEPPAGYVNRYRLSPLSGFRTDLEGGD